MKREKKIQDWKNILDVYKRQYGEIAKEIGRPKASRAVGKDVYKRQLLDNAEEKNEKKEYLKEIMHGVK